MEIGHLINFFALKVHICSSLVQQNIETGAGTGHGQDTPKALPN